MERLSDTRPWGWYKGVGFKRFWVKLIHVNRGHRTSEQYHHKRTELHVCLRRPWPWWCDGPAQFWKVRKVRRYEVHRLSEGRYIELAWGSPREDDIVRLGDDYGRTNSQPAQVGAGAPIQP